MKTLCFSRYLTNEVENRMGKYTNNISMTNSDSTTFLPPLPERKSLVKSNLGLFTTRTVHIV